MPFYKYLLFISDELGDLRDATLRSL